MVENPLGSARHIEAQHFLDLFEKAKRNQHPAIAEFEKKLGYAIENQWLDELAFHTQIVIKESELTFQHGRIVYSSLCSRLSGLDDDEHIQILETGTARGYSAVCMARALTDMGHQGNILTIDILPHNRPMYWNCVDDLSGPKTRKDLLSSWAELLKSITFLQEETLVAITRLGMQRVHFAFLDASHTYEDVMAEFSFVSNLQITGDVIVFDDVTDATFPGVVQAVEEIETRGDYKIDRVTGGEHRGYAVATRI
jgi:cephalosporin hydroxylase